MKTVLLLILALTATTTYRLYNIEEQLTAIRARQEVQRERATLMERAIATVWLREQLIEAALIKAE